jgi:hypothetical protein
MKRAGQIPLEFFRAGRIAGVRADAIRRGTIVSIFFEHPRGDAL